TNPAQSGAPDVLNENFETLEWSAVYGKRQPVTTGLIWGYYGGRWGGFEIATGDISVGIAGSPGSSNWDDPDFLRVYRVTTGSSSVSDVEDHRAGPSGVHGGGSGGGGGGGSSPLTTKGDLYTHSTVDARLPVGTNGKVLMADSAQTTGLKWAQLAESDITSLVSDL